MLLEFKKLTEVQGNLDHSKNELQEIVQDLRRNTDARNKYDDNLYFTITKREKKHFTHSNTVCTQCWDTPGYEPCHYGCIVPVPKTDHSPVPELIGVNAKFPCRIFHDEVYKIKPGNPANPNCEECECNWTYHMHVDYEWIEVEDQVESLSFYLEKISLEKNSP